MVEMIAKPLTFVVCLLFLGAQLSAQSMMGVEVDDVNGFQLFSDRKSVV